MDAGFFQQFVSYTGSRLKGAPSVRRSIAFELSNYRYAIRIPQDAASEKYDEKKNAAD